MAAGRATMWRMAHQHSLTADEEPVLFLRAAIVVAAALVAEVFAAGSKGAAAAQVAIAAVAILVLMLWLAVPVLRWRTTTYELTTRRLRMREGIVTRRGRDIPLVRINDVSFEKGLLDRLLGAGRLVVESAGEHGQIVLKDIPDVADVQATLFRLVEDEQRRLERNQRNQP